MDNLDCLICGNTSYTEIGGLPVCLDCFYAIQENDRSDIKEKVQNFRQNITYDDVEKVVCDFYNIDPSDIFVKKRDRNVILPRQICHHFAWKLNLGTLSAIGFRYGKKDHATVLHSNKAINDLKDTDKSFSRVYDELMAKLY